MKPLIIVFLKWPEPGRVKTRLARAVGDERAVEIYRALVARVGALLRRATRDEAMGSGVTVAVSYAPASKGSSIHQWLEADGANGFAGCPVEHWWAQPDADLGERQAEAVEKAFQEGYERVALIGTDCVDLTARHFSDTWERLESTDWVFGPAKDGGYYLGATRAGAPRPRDVFCGVRWSDPHTLDDCRENLGALGASVALLEPLQDVDDYESWKSVEERVSPES